MVVQLSLFDVTPKPKRVIGSWIKELWKDPEYRARTSAQRKGRKPWNKGLSAKTDERVRQNSKKTADGLKKSYREGKIKNWNAGIKIDRSKYPNMGHFQKHTEEARKKLSEALKGKDGYWKGKKLTDDAKIKLSEKAKLRGAKPPSQKGAIVSIETRMKRSESMMGKPGGFTGGRHTEKSREKIGEAFRGERHPNWKGGITPLVHRIRHCGKYVEWRKAIFERDNYTCQLCEKRGGHIEADHYPKPFSHIFSEGEIQSLEQALEYSNFWDISNGRTLCRPCHDKNKKWKEKKVR